MSYVTTKKTRWFWESTNGIMVCERRSDPSWRTVIDADFDAIRAKTSDEFYAVRVPAWQLQKLLNNAYECGRSEAMEDIKGMIG